MFSFTKADEQEQRSVMYSEETPSQVTNDTAVRIFEKVFSDFSRYERYNDVNLHRDRLTRFLSWIFRFECSNNTLRAASLDLFQGICFKGDETVGIQSVDPIFSGPVDFKSSLVQRIFSPQICYPHQTQDEVFRERLFLSARFVGVIPDDYKIGDHIYGATYCQSIKIAAGMASFEAYGALNSTCLLNITSGINQQSFCNAFQHVDDNGFIINSLPVILNASITLGIMYFFYQAFRASHAFFYEFTNRKCYRFCGIESMSSRMIFLYILFSFKSIPSESKLAIRDMASEESKKVCTGPHDRKKMFNRLEMTYSTYYKMNKDSFRKKVDRRNSLMREDSSIDLDIEAQASINPSFFNSSTVLFDEM